MVGIFLSMNKEDASIPEITKETSSNSIKESSSKKESSTTKESTVSSSSAASIETSVSSSSSEHSVLTSTESSTAIINEAANPENAQAANSPIDDEPEIYDTIPDWDVLYLELVTPVKQRVRDYFNSKTYADTGQPYLFVEHYIEDTFKFLNYANYIFNNEEEFREVIPPVMEEYAQKTMNRIEKANQSHYAFSEQPDKEQEE